MKKIVLFDMDGTLTPPRKELDRDLIPALRELAKISEIGIVTGSDHNYVLQQMGLLMENTEIRYKLHILPCNGTKYYPPPLSASHKHELTFEKNMREELGEMHFSSIMQQILRRQAQLHLYNLPLTGHFVDYRGSMINWCPIGRNATLDERSAFVEFDRGFSHGNFRNIVAEQLREEFKNSNIDLSIKTGGETSFDIYPKGWDKTFALQHFPDKEIWFIGDKCHEGGNDEEIYKALLPNNSFSVESPTETKDIIEKVLIPLFKGEKIER